MHGMCERAKSNESRFTNKRCNAVSTVHTVVVEFIFFYIFFFNLLDRIQLYTVEHRNGRDQQEAIRSRLVEGPRPHQRPGPCIGKCRFQGRASDRSTRGHPSGFPLLSWPVIGNRSTERVSFGLTFLQKEEDRASSDHVSCSIRSTSY